MFFIVMKNLYTISHRDISVAKNTPSIWQLLKSKNQFGFSIYPLTKKRKPEKPHVRVVDLRAFTNYLGLEIRNKKNK